MFGELSARGFKCAHEFYDVRDHAFGGGGGRAATNAKEIPTCVCGGGGRFVCVVVRPWCEF